MQCMTAAIAQWIRLCLPSCCQAFESKAHHSTLLSICLWIGRVEKDKNKRKRGRDWSLYKNYQLIRIGPRAYPQQQWVHSLKYLLMIFAADFIPIRYLLRHLIWKINTKDDFFKFQVESSDRHLTTKLLWLFAFLPKWLKFHSRGSHSNVQIDLDQMMWLTYLSNLSQSYSSGWRITKATFRRS